MPQVIINGESYDKVIVVNSSGTDIGGGGGGGGDASAANQVAGNNTLTSINNKIPPLVGGYQPTTLPNLEKAEDSVHTSGDFGILHLGVRQDSDGSPVSADGDYHSLIFNSTGRAKVSVKPGASAATTGTITTASSVVFVSVARESNVTVSISGTFAGVNATFEWSPDSTTGTDGNWYPVTAARSVGAVAESTTGVISATPVYNWRINVNGATFFRVRATAFTSGVANVVILPAAFATEPNPTVASIGSVGSITAALPTGTNTIGGVIDKPSTTGGTLMTRILSAATTNAAVVKASAGMVYGMQFNNSGATIAFVKLYNKATAPTVGTDVTVDVLAIPAGGSREVSRPLGMVYSAGISYAITGGFADADTAAVAAGQVVGSIQYF